MTTVRAFIERHPAPAYFALSLTISWVGILVVAAPGGLPGTAEQTGRLLPFAYLAMLAGPSVAGILLTDLVRGRAGLRALRARLLTWRVGVRWYAFALLAAPLLAAATLAALSLASPAFLPEIIRRGDRATLLLVGIAVGLGVAFFEEAGWTGFAVPELRARHAVLATGLIVGLLWGAWHIPLFYWLGGDAAGALSLPHFLPAVPFCLGILPVFRVLMVWVYERTGSLLVAMLMHASLTGGVSLILIPLALSGVSLATWYLILVAALWGVVAAVAVVDGGRLSRQMPRRRAA